MILSDWIEDVYGYHKKYIVTSTQYSLFGFAASISVTNGRFIKTSNQEVMVKFYGDLLSKDYFNLDGKKYASIDSAINDVDMFLEKLNKMAIFI